MDGDGATPVDLYGLLELTILHELTHSFQGGSSVDVPSAYGGGFTGFANAVSVGALGYTNAETLAFMGLIGKLVQLGFWVDFAGGLRQIAAEPPGKRSKRSFNGNVDPVYAKSEST